MNSNTPCAVFVHTQRIAEIVFQVGKGMAFKTIQITIIDVKSIVFGLAEMNSDASFVV